MVSRRRLLRTAGAFGIAAVLAGCTASEPTETPTASPTASPTATPTPTPEPTGTGVTRVDVGPEGRLRFVPADIEISVGDTVEWAARSPGHNVTSEPDAAPRCRNPEGAEPFSSYEGDSHFAIMEVEEVFTHEFTVPGEYVYVCTPHAGQGMVGSIVVTE
jgi:plastocyanin